jgi:hypothetical protein
MSPEERHELLGELQRRSQGRLDATDDSPEAIARTVQRAEQEDQDTGGLAGVFGFGGSRADERQAQEGSLQGMFDNPIVKIAIAGIAALAAKVFLSPDSPGGHHAGGHHH